MNKIKKIRSFLKKRRLDALLVTRGVNIGYLSNSLIQDSSLLLTKNKNIILTDFRYIAEAKKIKGFGLQQIDTSFMETLKFLVKTMRLKRIGFEGRGLSYNAYSKIKRHLTGIKLVEAGYLLEEMRMIKERDELKRIEKAVRITKLTFSYIRHILKVGITEIDLAKKIDIFIKTHSLEGNAFPTIVASGPNSAKPHAEATNRKLRQGEPIIVDLGVRYSGYNSDLTRTFTLGKINPKFYHIYSIVKTAQERAISAIKPGRSISQVDGVARRFIAEAGFGEQFGHALGHGVGREVHESPKISKVAKKHFLPNMVFTVEPAIYIPGWGGIRIEDMALVTQKGCKVLTYDIDKSI